jgi:2-aminoethylphosphonate aminotransferase
MMFPPRKILLNPGPATTSDTVKQALVVSDICPREADFGAVVSAVRRDLLAVAEADAAEHTAILLSGPGTAVVEATLGSIVPPHGRVLILDNGAYGARAGEIAAALGLQAHVWHVPWTSCPDPADLAAQLDSSAGPFTHAFWVHHETTTGLLNPLRAYGEVCRARGVTTIVDGMSSFAGMPLALRDEPVDLFLSSANKCLQGMPGVSFALVRRTALAASAGVCRSVALDLHRHERSLAAGGQFPFTPPVPVVYALAQALRETLIETVAVRAARYRACYETMLAGMETLGFEPLLPRALHSGLLTAFRTPAWPRFSFEALHDHLYARDITLYPGKLPGTATFRVANIGALVPADLAAFVAETGRFLNAH